MLFSCLCECIVLEPMTKIISTVANMIIPIEVYQHKEEIHWLYTSIHFRLFHSIPCPNFAQGRLPHFLRFENSFLLTMLKVWVVIEIDNGCCGGGSCSLFFSSIQLMGSRGHVFVLSASSYYCKRWKLSTQIFILGKVSWVAHLSHWFWKILVSIQTLWY